MSVSVSDVKNLTYQILPSKEVLVKKITNGSEGSLSINFQIKMPVLKDTARTTLKIYSESEPCDCIMTHDTSVTELVLYQIKKKDTSVNAVEELQKTEQETCIDFFDIMGRFIETNCSSEQMVAPNVRKKKAIKIGNNLIKYID